LIVAEMPTASDLAVTSDEDSFYGRRYFDRLSEQYDQPSLDARARTDLPERCVYWLRTLLKYKAPPAKVLELGSAHGGFVALLRAAGYDATGLDLSPALVDAARRRFGVPILVGPIETQAIDDGSLDVVALMDVLEHLPDPVAAMSRCRDLLSPRGLLIMQTPRYVENRSFEEMTGSNDPFLQQLKPDQHLLLFSESSLRLFLKQLGFEHVAFEPAIFSQYDQFAVASREPLQPAGRVLGSASQQWLAQALIDSREIYEVERAAQLEVIKSLEGKWYAAERDREARLKVIEKLAHDLAIVNHAAAPLRALSLIGGTIRRLRPEWLSRIFLSPSPRVQDAANRPAGSPSKLSPNRVALSDLPAVQVRQKAAVAAARWALLREALVSSAGSDSLAGKRLLELYAGSDAFGLEVCLGLGAAAYCGVYADLDDEVQVEVGAQIGVMVRALPAVVQPDAAFDLCVCVDPPANADWAATLAAASRLMRKGAYLFIAGAQVPPADSAPSEFERVNKDSAAPVSVFLKK
jgi:SAM-dependent methyltransferase